MEANSRNLYSVIADDLGLVLFQRDGGVRSAWLSQCTLENRDVQLIVLKSHRKGHLKRYLEY